VQALPSSQLAGQLAIGSQVSPVSTTPLPQVAEQSESFAAVHVAAQQPSPPTQVVMGRALHATLHAWALPVSWSSVQALPSSQLVGHEVAGSQVSPASTMPLPQTAASAPPVGEVPPPPMAPPPLETPPEAVPPPVLAEAPPVPPDWLEDSELEHDGIAAAMLNTATANEVLFIPDSPSVVRQLNGGARPLPER
jgi:hypothetical protein